VAVVGCEGAGHGPASCHPPVTLTPKATVRALGAGAGNTAGGVGVRDVSETLEDQLDEGRIGSLVNTSKPRPGPLTASAVITWLRKDHPDRGGLIGSITMPMR
jgi:hypothetical protein